MKRLLLSLFGVLGIAMAVSVVTKVQPTVLKTKATALPGQLSCRDVVTLGDWSVQHYGGPKKTDISSSQFARQAARTFIEKLDPTKLLFTKKEAKAFEKLAAKHWKDIVRSQSCDFFGQWFDENYPTAKARLTTNVESHAAALAKIPGGKTSKKFSDWAADEADLKSRAGQYAEYLLKEATPKVLKAYGNDKALYVRTMLEETVFDDEVTAERLLAKSMLASIDGYSTYFSKEEFDDFYSDLSGGTSGIGIQVRKVPQGLLIEKILKGSSAGRSKQIHLGDIITAIDGVKVANLSHSQAKHLLKGVEDSTIRLSLLQETSEQTEVSLERKAFAFEDANVSGRWMKDSSGKEVAVVAVPNFYGRGGMTGNEERSSSEDLKQVLSELLQTKKDAPLVLDLRGNPGGYLEEAVTMAGFFIGEAPVVGVVENENTRVMKEEMPTELGHQGSLVVLVDEETASASEVLAGALKDHQKAILVGSPRTYGKGSVQKLFHLDDPLLSVGLENMAGNGVLKLTTSVFYSPLGHSPANGGIETHIAISKATKEIAPLVEGVPDIPPLLDDQTLLMIQAKEETVKERVALLAKRHTERGSKDLADEKDSELAESIRIAADAEEMQQAVSQAASQIAPSPQAE